MASVVIQGDTSGSVTLQAPAVAGSTTVNLPSTIGNAGTSAVVTTDASGNVGIGVTPSAWASARKVLQVGSSSSLHSVTNNTFVGNNCYSDGTSRYLTTGVAGIYGQESDGGHKWYTAPSGTAGSAITWTQAMTLDASGNLGVGVTPSAWSANGVLQVRRAAMYSDGSFTAFANNWYTNAGDKYIANDYATQYYQLNGQHVWRTAPSGTAGNAITFTQAMTLDANGSLIVGSTSSMSTSASTRGQVSVNGSTDSVIALGVGGTFTGFFYAASTLINFGSRTAIPLTFHTSDTERARITSGGEFYIAGTTDQGAYNLQVNGTGVWGAGAYVNGSDARIKEEIQPIDSGLDVVQKLNPVTYKYKEDWTKDRSTQTGFIAQELLVALEGKNYVDGVVTQGGSEGYYSVAYQNIIPILTKAIQELNAKVEAQAAEIAALKAAGSN